MTYEGGDIVNDYFETALNKSFDWMTMKPMGNVLKSVLLCNILAAFVYNSSATFAYLTKKWTPNASTLRTSLLRQDSLSHFLEKTLH